MFAERLFAETGASDIKGLKEGRELGQELFKYRCKWVEGNL